MSTGGWGSQIGSAAAGVGGAVASVELAKHDPKLYYKMQMAGMWFMGIVLLLMLIIVDDVHAAVGTGALAHLGV